MAKMQKMARDAKDDDGRAYDGEAHSAMMSNYFDHFSL